MAKNYIQPGSVVTVTAPADVTSGSGVLIGTLFGVATHDAKSGEPLELKTDGVWELAKTSAQAWATVGLAIYSTAAGVLTTTATDNVLVGKNLVAAANPSPTGTVRLNG
ncbi:bacteriophage VT1-sakai [Tribonema minus]|uniref:Bacteriophage VT1-sakai n=1 Tax=Tribonema minus TaxID=303371 RepID=A0A835Z1G6_9STRA|nr:bacteriophage VT1-sakai [Tribonema minus]